MVVLHQFEPGWGLPNTSAFALKLHAWMRMTGIAYTTKTEIRPGKGPTRKIPWVDDGDVTLGDSSLIIEHFKRTRGVDPDARLTPRERAQALALQRLAEDHYHFCQVWTWFVDDEGWSEYKRHLGVSVPMQAVAGWMFRGRYRANTWGHGIGRHKREDIYAFARADLDAFDALLEAGPFFFGDTPTTSDCAVYGVVAITRATPYPHPYKDHLLANCPRLVRFLDAMQTRLFAEPVAEIAASPAHAAAGTALAADAS